MLVISFLLAIGDLVKENHKLERIQHFIMQETNEQNENLLRLNLFRETLLKYCSI
jgi:hypothetical protein